MGGKSNEEDAGASVVSAAFTGVSYSVRVVEMGTCAGSGFGVVCCKLPAISESMDCV